MIVGIDPGFSGAIAFYDGTSLICYPMPVVDEEYVKAGKKRLRKMTDLPLVVSLFKEHKPTYAIIEKVNAMSNQGVTSMHRFGINYGHIQGVVASFDLTNNFVRPQVWKTHFDLINTDKNSSLELARAIWPEHAKTSFRLKKHDGLAEASLIAKYAYDNNLHS